MRLTNNTGQRKGYKYKCDRCGKLMIMKDRYLIKVSQTYDISHQKWDLCPRCYKALERGIEKGKKNK